MLHFSDEATYLYLSGLFQNPYLDLFSGPLYDWWTQFIPAHHCFLHLSQSGFFFLRHDLCLSETEYLIESLGMHFYEYDNIATVGYIRRTKEHNRGCFPRSFQCTLSQHKLEGGVACLHDDVPESIKPVRLKKTTTDDPHLYLCSSQCLAQRRSSSTLCPIQKWISLIP